MWSTTLFLQITFHVLKSVEVEEKNVISVFVLTHLPEAWDKWKLWKNLFE